MTRTKRPKLGDVLRGGDQTSPTAPPTAPALPQEQEANSDQAVEKLVQLNVTVSQQLRREVRIKALQDGVEVGTLVRRLLQEWLDRKS
ncbi:hypothetical protein [Deinococcus sp. QL22]|uniref:hypothetical protein n=1 Tax=Deinococcus sp. QL22 TaxID=2939437 RepID=UPI002017B5C9|nr:hypothetical protein [Deinococcus sp. QL22]UQN10665.1 hypothetical protein M1R55_30280 [Deinococcus sp. QL22]